MAAVAPEPPSSETIERGWPAEHWHGAASRVECSRPVTACVLGCAYACCAPCPCCPCREVTAKPIGPFSHAVRFARMCAPWLSLRPILEWNCEDIPVLPRAFVVSNDGDLEPYAEYAAHVDDPGYSGRYRAHDGGGLGASVPGWIGRGGGDYAVLLPHGLQQSLRARRGLAPRVELCVVERRADCGGGQRLHFRFRTRADRRDWLEDRGLTATTRAIAGAESVPKSAEKSDGVDHSAMLLLASAPGPMFAEIAELASSTGAAGGGALSPAEPLPDARALFDDLMARPRGKFVSVPDVDRRLPRYNTMLVHIASSLVIRVAEVDRVLGSVRVAVLLHTKARRAVVTPWALGARLLLGALVAAVVAEVEVARTVRLGAACNDTAAAL